MSSTVRYYRCRHFILRLGEVSHFEVLSLPVQDANSAKAPKGFELPRVNEPPDCPLRHVPNLREIASPICVFVM